jgi:hypothetical protein
MGRFFYAWVKPVNVQQMDKQSLLFATWWPQGLQMRASRG